MKLPEASVKKEIFWHQFLPRPFFLPKH